jgi:hypothetical protein
MLLINKKKRLKDLSCRFRGCEKMMVGGYRRCKSSRIHFRCRKMPANSVATEGSEIAHWPFRLETIKTRISAWCGRYRSKISTQMDGILSFSLVVAVVERIANWPDYSPKDLADRPWNWTVESGYYCAGYAGSCNWTVAVVWLTDPMLDWVNSKDPIVHHCVSV